METGRSENFMAVVIEDDENLAYFFRVALEGASFETAVFLDGASGSQAVKELCPSLVLLDINLPQVSGLEILKEVRQNQALQNTRVILTTADPEKSLALEYEPDLVLVKPVSSSQLQELACRLVFGSNFPKKSP